MVMTYMVRKTPILPEFRVSVVLLSLRCFIDDSFSPLPLLVMPIIRDSSFSTDPLLHQLHMQILEGIWNN